MNAASDPAPLRVFLFKREFVDVFHLRLAVGMAFERSHIDVLDQNETGMSLARALVRSRSELPTLILFEQRRRGSKTAEVLRRICGLPELQSFPVVVLGDAEEPDSVLHAHEDGADGFIPLPERASELPRIGRDVAQFWWNRQLSKSA